MSDQDRWSEDASAVYRQLAKIAVPARTDQLATLLTLIPFGKDDEFKVVELASGEGRLSYAILSAFPNATVLALDFEQSMREETADRLSEFGERVQVEAFDMMLSDWYSLMAGADVVVSSLCIHHLTGEGKQGLFRAVNAQLSTRGAFLIADLVLPQRSQANEVFSATWDASAKRASYDLTGDDKLFGIFEAENWNYYRVPDDFDKPSPLFHQLKWLESAGFKHVDCFWMQAGHAIYGGYMPSAGDDTVGYEQAYHSATLALAD